LFRLSDLLEQLHQVNGIERIRFITNFPRDMTNDLLQAVRDLPKVMKYLHVPAQSGCNDVLKRMKRGYSVEDYREMMLRIRELVPNCAVSSDFIVGFCGESQSSFRKACSSSETAASKTALSSNTAPAPVPRPTNSSPMTSPTMSNANANQEMLELQNRISEEDNAEFIGRRVTILVEGPSKSAARRSARDGLPTDGGNPLALLPNSQLSQPDHNHPHHDHDHDSEHLLPAESLQHASPQAQRLATQLTGRTTCDRIVVFDGNPRLTGSVADIEIHDCTSTTLLGSIVTRELQSGSGLVLPILL
jgi:tRNA-2-methylthio-N6-dimethylallyladenosine synthase